MPFRPLAGVLLGLLVPCLWLAPARPATAQPVADDNAATRAEAYRLFLHGRHLESSGDVEAAVRAYREAAELDPESGELLAELSSVYARRNQNDEAVEVARESLERDPENQSAHRILGLIFAARASERSGTADDAQVAVRHLEQARETPVADFHVELTLARLYLRTDAAQSAVDLLEELQKDAPGLSETGMLLARAYEQVGRVGEAVTTLERVVAGGRPSSRALRRLAELYGKDGRWGDAVEVYERAVDLNPRSARTKRELANALLRAKRPERARDVLDDLVTQRPNDVAGLYLLSEVELELRNFDAAEAAARRLMEVEPGGFRGALALAEVYSQKREHGRVVEVLEPLLETPEDHGLRPDQIAGLLGRIGFAHEQLQEYEAASRVYEQGVKMLPNSLAFGGRLAQAYIDSARLPDARRVLRDVREQHGENLAVIRLEARVLGDEGDIDAGVAMLQEALESRTERPRAYLTLAAYYSRYERFDAAIELLESATARFRDDTSVLFRLGAVLEQNGRSADAERRFRRILELDPEHAAALNYLGYMLADRGERLEESVILLERAIETDPYNGAYLDSLGWAYFKLDRLDRAEALLQQASEQMAWNSVIQDHFGDLMRKLGRYADAIAAWERALAGDGHEVERAAIERKIGDARRQLER